MATIVNASRTTGAALTPPTPTPALPAPSTASPPGARALPDRACVMPDDGSFSYPCIPQQRFYDARAFPLVLSPPSHAPLLDDPAAVGAHLRAHRAALLRKAERHGALYFRGFAPQRSDARDFARWVVDALGLRAFRNARGNAVRRSIVPGIVQTANEAPSDKRIPMHHELAQTPTWPRWVLFYCDHPAQTGGETPIAHSPTVLQQLNPHFVAALRTHGVTYRRTMTPHDRPQSAIGRGWMSTFNARTKQQAEQALTEKGYSWEWRVTTVTRSKREKEDEKEEVQEQEEQEEQQVELLTEISPVLPAVLQVKHSHLGDVTQASENDQQTDGKQETDGDGQEKEEEEEEEGKLAFFNQIYAAWFGWRDEFNTPTNAVRLGNGAALRESDMQRLDAVLRDEEVAVPWQRGDFMLIDNTQAMHSRRAFSGKRVVLASLAE